MRSPKIIGSAIGIGAIAFLAISWHIRGQKIETLNALIALANATCEQNMRELEDRIAQQNEALDDLENQIAERERQLGLATERAVAARKDADRRIEEIMSSRPVVDDDATEIERSLSICRQAVDNLRRARNDPDEMR